MLINRYSIILTLAALVDSANAAKYAVPMNHSEWNLELSRFECRMWQPIPIYGDAVFQYRAGEKQRFFLSPTRKMMKTGKAKLESAAPSWDESRKAKTLGYVAVNDSNTPVRLYATEASQLLSELDQGMSPMFTRRAWYSESERVQVGLSSVNFRSSYDKYRKCLATLLPVNFDQVAKSRLRFPPSRWELTKATIKRLDTIVGYVKADPSVTGFFVDGHTDNQGRRLANLDLSKKRAEAVTEYLVAKGVDESMITTRYHGERYPIVKNNTLSNRIKNRRVTIRLERKKL